MSNLTALQQAMRTVEQYAPQLFDSYNANGRRFIDEMTKLLGVERNQIEMAYNDGMTISNAYAGSSDYYIQEYQEKRTKKQIDLIRHMRTGMEVKKYLPACFSGYKDEYAHFRSLDELLAIEWIASWKEQNEFYQYSISREQWLMAEFKNGSEFWTIAYFPEVLDEVQKWFPKWIAKNKGGEQ